MPVHDTFDSFCYTETIFFHLIALCLKVYTYKYHAVHPNIIGWSEFYQEMDTFPW